MTATSDVEGVHCTRCHAPMEPDQEWCLECGDARTVIRSPPDWRIPALLVGTIVLGALVAFAIALINLTNTGAGRPPAPAAATSSRAATTTAPATTTTATATTASSAATVSSWPAGLSGWTVVLVQTQDQTSATAAARQLAAKGLHVGVIDSSQHPHLSPGQWMVFSGRYPDEADAQAAAARLAAAGHPGATAVEVAPPGGI